MRGAIVGLAAVLAAALIPVGEAAAQAIVVGGRTSTEQRLVAEMTSQLLRAKGFSAEVRVGLAAAALRQAQETGQIDLSWEQAGPVLAGVHKVADRLDAVAAHARVRELDAGRGLVWLGPSRVGGGQALAVRAAEARGLTSLSDLAAKIKAGEALRLGCAADFAARPDGVGALQAAYGFEFGREAVVRVEAGLVAQALRDKRIDVGLVAATDARVPALGLVLLKDDKGFFPGSALAPVVRRDVLERNPRLAEVLAALAARLDETVMAKLNASVEVDRKGVGEVAASFLKGMGLI